MPHAAIKKKILNEQNSVQKVPIFIAWALREEPQIQKVAQL